MKVALPVEEKSLDEPVCPSFGRTPFFALVDTESGVCEFRDNTAAASQGGAGVQAAQLLVDSGVQALVTYRCGENAARVLEAAGVRLLKAQEGSVRDNLTAMGEERLSLLTGTHPGFHHTQGGAQ
jgi:predicted Fe-Mo cluster-binding NifX family protein